MIPRLIADEPDVEVCDAEVRDATPHDVTRIYDMTIRHPAREFAARFPILAGFEAGAPTDLIALSIAAGRRWKVGPLGTTAGYPVIRLSRPDLPLDQQIAAWPASHRPVRDLRR